jgi:hypothetical protein
VLLKVQISSVKSRNTVLKDIQVSHTVIKDIQISNIVIMVIQNSLIVIKDIVSMTATPALAIARPTMISPLEAGSILLRATLRRNNSLVIALLDLATTASRLWRVQNLTRWRVLLRLR